MVLVTHTRRNEASSRSGGLSMAAVTTKKAAAKASMEALKAARATKERIFQWEKDLEGPRPQGREL